MKKHLFLIAAAGLAFASCTSEDVVAPNKGGTASDNAIGFAVTGANMSRATALEEVTNNFGVWAVKANSFTELQGLTLNLNTPATLDPQVVMNNYEVKHITEEHYGSLWNYVKDYDATLPAGQSLKYWDASFTNTYFFAYTPYNAGTQIEKSADGSTVTLPIGTIKNKPAEDSDPLYADVKKAVNADFVHPNGSVDNPQKVNLTFHRLQSQVQIKFWENIPGYKIQLVEFKFNGVDGNHGVVAMPADYTAPTTWSRGKLLSEGVASVNFTDTDYATTSVSFADAKMADTDLEFAKPAGEIGTTRATATPSATKMNVIPNNGTSLPDEWTMATGEDWKANSGLQFVLSYKLIAEDTKEEITVKGARVYVPAQYTAWAPNTLYTYYFQITKNSSGTTGGPDPNPDPDQPEDALYPIIFDSLSIVDLEDGTVEETDWVINQTTEFNPASITTYKAGETHDIDVIVGYNTTWNTSQDITWTSSAEAVVKVANASTNTVTPIAGETYKGTATNSLSIIGNGCATIKATYYGVTGTCEIFVYTSFTADATLNIAAGATATLDVQLNADDVPDGYTVAYASDNEAVATVATNGVVTNVAAGTANITTTLTTPNGCTLTATTVVTCQ